MSATHFLQAGANVQIVCSLADLREMFMTWQDERDALKPAPKEDKLLTADEAADQLGVTSVTLWRWAKMGYLKPSKVGRKVYYWEGDLNKLLTRKEG